MPDTTQHIRRSDTDLIKALAIVLVVYNHSSAYNLYANLETGSPLLYPLLFLSVLCKVGVPLFLGVSGALLLGKDEEIGFIWKKRVSKAAFILLGASLIYFFLRPNYMPGPFTLSHFISNLYSHANYGHLWYLYIYLCFLIGLPFLRMIARSLDEKKVIYLVALVFAFKLIEPCAQAIFGINAINLNYVPNYLVTNVVCFPLLGYWMLNKADTARLKKLLPYLLLVALLSLLLTTFASTCVYKTDFDLSDELNNSSNIATFLLVFALVKLADMQTLSTRAKVFLATIADNTLLVYLIHPIVHALPPLKALSVALGYKTIPFFFLAILRCAITLVLSEIACTLVLKVPLFHKFFIGSSDAKKVS